MESALERLARLYADMGDGQLLAMSAQPEDLTEDASLALTGELRRRKLTPHLGHGESFTNALPGIVPSPNQALETALEPGGETRQGMATLAAFYDGLQLSKACAALEEADLEFAIQEVPGEPSGGVPGRFEIWVETADQELARSVLREKMGLFPAAEVDDTHPRSDPDRETSGDDAEGELVVASFTSVADAEEVRGILSAVGFTARIEGDELDPDETSVLVPAAEQERALDLLAQRLGIETS